MSFVDLHAHLIPGLDDGPADVKETLALLELAHAGGTRSLVATPHRFLPSFPTTPCAAVADTFAHLVAAFADLSLQPEFAYLAEMTLYLGSENYLCAEFLAALDSGQVIPLNDSRYLLVEFPQFMAFEMVLSAAKRILAAGYMPVLAHVERYEFFHKDPQRLAGLAAMGCVAQLNASTLLGGHGSHGSHGPRGERQARFAAALVRQNLIQIIASDTHDSRRRPPDLSRAHQHLEAAGFASQARRWMWENPARVLANQELLRGPFSE